ncbi:MAG: homoserine dehydrogenase [Lachnospiraceae bacterium]
MLQLAILGYGTIGAGVAQVLLQKKQVVTAKAGQEIDIKYILDLRDFPGDPLEDKVIHDVNIILNDPEVSLVVETMGGTKPAYNFVKAALLAGKSVATSNKELVAKYGAELLQIAQEKQINFLFEASVGGAIPIIRPLNECISGDDVMEITGILNGTTNFILTKMAKEGLEFEDVLKQAQALGYAERNPAADVEGKDACRKIAILASMAYGYQVNEENVYTEGITKITAVDMQYAESFGLAVKLFGTCRKVGNEVYVMVCPMLVAPSHPLYAVNDVMNGVLVRGDFTGELMFYGAGAGKLPTATAVVADIVDEAKNLNKTVMKPWKAEALQVADYRRLEHRFMVRLQGNAQDRAEEIKEVFGTVTDIAATVAENEFAVLTDIMTEEKFEHKINQIDGLISRIRLA